MATKNPASIGFMADTALRRGLERPQTSFSELEQTFFFEPKQIQKLHELMKCLNLSEKTILNMAIIYAVRLDAKTKMNGQPYLHKVTDRVRAMLQNRNGGMEELPCEITLSTKIIVEAQQMEAHYNSLAASGLARLHANLNIDQIKDIA